MQLRRICTNLPTKNWCEVRACRARAALKLILQTTVVRMSLARRGELIYTSRLLHAVNKLKQPALVAIWAFAIRHPGYARMETRLKHEMCPNTPANPGTVGSSLLLF